MEHFGFQGIFFWREETPKETERYPEEFEAALNFACLETNGKRILIDTGFGEQADKQKRALASSPEAGGNQA